jgi:hypothetical protein
VGLLANNASVRISYPTGWPLLIGPPAKNRIALLVRHNHGQSFPYCKRIQIAYSADYYDACSAGLDNGILHGPCPIPVDLQSSVAIYKDQMARGKLLVSKVRSVHIGPSCIARRYEDSQIQCISEITTHKYEIAQKTAASISM